MEVYIASTERLRYMKFVPFSSLLFLRYKFCTLVVCCSNVNLPLSFEKNYTSTQLGPLSWIRQNLSPHCIPRGARGEEFSSVNPCSRIKSTLKYYLCNSPQLRSSLLVLLRNRQRHDHDTNNYIISRATRENRHTLSHTGYLCNTRRPVTQRQFDTTLS